MVQPTMELLVKTLTIEYRTLKSLTPNPDNARTHSKKQISQIAKSIEQFGFRAPVLIDGKGLIIAGHGRVEAARKANLETIPTICCDDMSDAQIRAYMIADNKLASNAGWDEVKLASEFDALLNINFDLELTGFEFSEIEALYTAVEPEPDPDEDDEIPEVAPDGQAISQMGDLWLLGEHRLFCGDSTDPASYERLLGGDHAEMVFTDPPYNVAIQGHVSGLGKAQHREFEMASGEMSEEDFTAFLRTVTSNLVAFSTDGSIHYICMDWRHAYELQAAARGVYSEMKNICIWAKTNGGMGSLYRSQHELVFIYKNGTAPHINNVELGKHGRYRTNVWRYAGANSFGKRRNADLAAHPTVKPVALVADAIKDCSKRGGLILDPFAGSGTIFLAAARTGRLAAGIELDPLYVDVAIRRFEALAGNTARHATMGESFGEVAAARDSSAPAIS